MFALPSHTSLVGDVTVGSNAFVVACIDVVRGALGPLGGAERPNHLRAMSHSPCEIAGLQLLQG